MSVWIIGYTPYRPTVNYDDISCIIIFVSVTSSTHMDVFNTYLHNYYNICHTVLQLRVDFEGDKEQAIACAMTGADRDVDRARRMTEDQLKEAHAEEIKKLTQKHKAEISTTKKKQWVR